MPAFADYYEQCESGLKTRVRTLTDLFPNNWQVDSNDAVLSKGANNFFILMPGAVIEQSQEYEKDIDWHVTAELYVRFTAYEAAKRQFKVARAKIIWVVKSDDSLGGTKKVWKTGISAPEKPLYYWMTRTAAENGA